MRTINHFLFSIIFFANYDVCVIRANAMISRFFAYISNPYSVVCNTVLFRIIPYFNLLTTPVIWRYVNQVPSPAVFKVYLTFHSKIITNFYVKFHRIIILFFGLFLRNNITWTHLIYFSHSLFCNLTNHSILKAQRKANPFGEYVFLYKNAPAYI